MRKKIGHINKKFICILISVCLIGGTINLLGDKIIETVCKNLKIEFLDTGWSFLKNSNEAEEIQLPTTIKNIDYDMDVEIEKEISTIKYGEATLLLRSELQSIDVYVNDEKVKSLKKSSKQIFGKESESDWFFISLPSNEKSVKVKIVYNSKYEGYNGRINNIILGNYADEILYIIAKGILKVLAAIILFSIGSLLLAIYLGNIKYNKINNKELLYLALLNIITGFWNLFYSNILDVFLPNIIPRAEFKLLSMFFIPVIYLKLFTMYCSETYSKILDIIRKFILIYIIIASILHILNVVNYMESIFVFHGLGILTIIMCIAIWIKENYFKNNIDFEKITVIALMLVIALVDMIVFYKDEFYKESRIFEYSVMVSTILFSYHSCKRTYCLKKEVEIDNKNNYRDPLTGLLTRMAFEKRIMEMDKNLKKHLGTPIFMFNLNNLRRMNETLGHYKGNEYIKNNAEVLKDIFQDDGDLYRIGVDHFAFIGNKKMSINQCEEKLSGHVEKSLPEKKIYLTGIAYGYDIVSKDTKSIYEVNDKAEINMNKLKKRLKRSNIR